MIPLSRPSLGNEEIASVVEVLESGMLASGERVEAFEAAFASAVGSPHAIAVGSGTAALHIGLLALGVGAGDEVVVPSLTFAASANAVALAGATPVFADVDERDFTVHPQHIEPVISDRTVAIMPVHLYGQMAPMNAISHLAESRGLAVVEDAAQAHMAEESGRKAGSIGELGAFSFYPTKNMTTGEGGMITTPNSDIAGMSRLLRNQGMSQRYVHDVVGLNERMTEMEAAIGLAQLRLLPERNKRRREIAGIYQERLDPALGLPHEREDATHVYHQYTITPPDREKIRAALRSAGVGHDVYYPMGAHQQAPYRSDVALPATERLVDRVLSIPVRPDLTDDEIEYIIDTLNRAIGS